MMSIFAKGFSFLNEASRLAAWFGLGRMPQANLPLEIDATLIPAHLSEEEANDYEASEGEVFTTPKSVRVGDGETAGGGLRIYNQGQRILQFFDEVFDPNPTGLFNDMRCVLDKGSPVFAVTGNATTDVLTAPGHNFSNGDRITFLSITGTANLQTSRLCSASSFYYVRDVAGDTFKIADSPGGAAKNWTGTFTAGTVQRLARVDLGTYLTTTDGIYDPVVMQGGASFDTLLIDATTFSNYLAFLDMSGLINLKKLMIDGGGSMLAGPKVDCTGLNRLEELYLFGYLPVVQGDMSGLRYLHLGSLDTIVLPDFAELPSLEEFVYTGYTGGGFALDLNGAAPSLAVVRLLNQIDGDINISAPTALPSLTTFLITNGGSGLLFQDTTGLTAVTSLTLNGAAYATGAIGFTNMVGLTSLATLLINNMGNSGEITLPASSGNVGTLASLTSFIISGQYGSVSAASLTLIAAALVAANNNNGTFSVEWNYGDSTWVDGDLTTLNGHLATLRSRGWTAPDLVEPVE